MMKKTIVAIAAAVMMSANLMAQDDQKQDQQPQQPDKTEMIKQHTDQMVKDYGLNEEQADKLLALNTEYADKLPMMFRGPRRKPTASVRSAPRTPVRASARIVATVRRWTARRCARTWRPIMPSCRRL